MKHAFTLLLGIWLTVSLAGCAPAQEQPVPTGTPVPPTATPQPAPTATPAPTPAPDLGPWKLLRQLEYKDNDSAINFGAFLNESHGILVGYSGLVRYTSNGGQNWDVGNSSSLCRFGLDIVDEQIAWNCGNGGHVRVSTDGGATWKPVTDYGKSEPDHCRYLSFLDAQTGWAAAPAMLGATLDGGVTWTDLSLPKGTSKIAAISLRTPTEGYVLDIQGVLLVTADGGKTWTLRSLSLPKGGKLPMDFAPLTAMRFWDAQHGRVVYNLSGQFWTATTEDGGITWKQQAMPDVKGIYNLFLTRDGQTLSAIDVTKRKILILQYQQP